MNRWSGAVIPSKTPVNAVFFLPLALIASFFCMIAFSPSVGAISLDLKLPLLELSPDASTQARRSTTTPPDTVSSQKTESANSRQTIERERASSAANQQSTTDGESSLQSEGIKPLPTLPYIDEMASNWQSARMSPEPLFAAAAESGQKTPPTKVMGVLESTSGGWRILGIYWYWWMVGISGLVAASYVARRVAKGLATKTIVS